MARGFTDALLFFFSFYSFIRDTICGELHCRKRFETILMAVVDCELSGSSARSVMLIIAYTICCQHKIKQLIDFFLKKDISGMSNRMVLRSGNIEPITDYQISHRCKQTNVILNKLKSQQWKAIWMLAMEVISQACSFFTLH